MAALTAIAIIIRYVFISFYESAITILVVVVSADAIFTIVRALIKKIKGAWIIGIGVLFFILFVLVLVALASFGISLSVDDSIGGHILMFILSLAILSIPISMSVYLAWSFSSVNKNLASQLEQVKMLSEKTLEQEQEKIKLISGQNEMLEQKVEERTRALKETQGQLVQQEKLASLGALTAGIAHEIKNPLNFVNNFADLSNELLDELKTAKSDEERNEIIQTLQQNLEKINHHGKRADSIVKSMLEHSRTGSGDKQLTDINKLSDEFLNLAYHGMRANVADFNCAIEKNLGADLPKVKIVQQDISRVLLNLFNNAFYAIRDNPDAKLSLTTSSSNSSIIIKIKDNGSGMADHVKQKIFEPFFTTKPSGEGTGLGLSLSFDIIKAHGGKIEVFSEEGKGTEFMITLPVA